MAVETRAILVLESDGAANPDDYTVTRPFRVWDVHGVEAVNGLATTTISRQALGTGAFNALSSAISSGGGVGTLARTTLLAPAQYNCLPTDVLRILDAGAGRLLCYIKIIPRLIAGA